MSGIAARATAAQDALLVILLALKAQPALAQWHVDYGRPPDRTERECWIDEQVTTTAEEVTSGEVCSDAKFTLYVWLYAERTAATAVEIRNDVDAAAELIETAIRIDPTLGGRLMSAYVSGVKRDGGLADSEGRSRDAAMTIDVACTAFVG